MHVPEWDQVKRQKVEILRSHSTLVGLLPLLKMSFCFKHCFFVFEKDRKHHEIVLWNGKTYWEEIEHLNPTDKALTFKLEYSSTKKLSLNLEPNHQYQSFHFPQIIPCETKSHMQSLTLSLFVCEAILSPIKSNPLVCNEISQIIRFLSAPCYCSSLRVHSLRAILYHNVLKPKPKSPPPSQSHIFPQCTQS